MYADNEKFQDHLKSHSKEIKSLVSQLRSKASGDPAIAELQARLVKQLAEERSTRVDLERSVQEKKELDERLEAASLRYMRSEKKLDSLKSPIAQKLENGQLFGGQPKNNAAASKTSAPVKLETNGTLSNAERNLELEEKHQSAVAVAEKQKEQIVTLESENAKLAQQLTEISVKVRALQKNLEYTILTC